MSTRLLDGPGHGVTFMLRSAPTFLRVVQGPKQWDALDQLTDDPEPDETIHVYQLVPGTWSRVHIRASKRAASGCWTGGDYRHVPDAPVEVLRDGARWRAWATLRFARDVESQPALPARVAGELARLDVEAFRVAAADVGAVETTDGWTLP